MPRRDLLLAVTRVLDRLGVAYHRDGDEWVRFEWPYSGEGPTPVSLVVFGNRLIACYATVTGVEVDDERWGTASDWVAETNQSVIVGNFELLGEGVIVYKNAIDAELLDAKTVERVLPELWALAVRMAEEHRDEVMERLEQAELAGETIDQLARDAIEGILQVVEGRFGRDVAEGVTGAVEQVVHTYLEYLFEMNDADDGESDDADEDAEGDDADDEEAAEPWRDESVAGEDDEESVELPVLQYELEGNRDGAALLLRAGDFPPMRYEFSPAALLDRARADEQGIVLYYHAAPDVAERVVSHGFENERHEVVLSDMTVDGHPDLEPERVVTRRVLLTSRPRPLDDRELHDATVRVRWTGDARPLTAFEWTRTAFAEHDGGWDATPIETPERRFLVPAAVLNEAAREGVSRLERVGG